MNVIPASEIKRRGVIALEESLKKGPVYIIKNNRPACVVLSEEAYHTLINRPQDNASINLWELIDKRSWKGKRKKSDIHKQIKEEREDWTRKK